MTGLERVENDTNIIINSLRTRLYDLKKEKEMNGYYYQLSNDEYRELVNEINSIERLLVKHID